MTGLLKFDEVIDKIMAEAPLLTDLDVLKALSLQDYKPVQLYLYRIAAYAVAKVRKASEDEIDDSDYLDALGECALLIEPVLVRWRKGTHVKLSTYAQRAFEQTAKRFLAANAYGGMVGDVRDFDDAPAVVSVEVLTPDEDEDGNESEYTWNDYVTYPMTPVGYREPLAALLAEEAVTQVLTKPQRLDKAATNRLRAELGSTTGIRRR